MFQEIPRIGKVVMVIAIRPVGYYSERGPGQTQQE